MSSPLGVLLVTNEPETATAVSAALESNGHFAPEGVCKNLQELVAALERAPARGVVVDLDPAPTQVLAGLDPIIARFRDARFIVVSKTQHNGLVLEAMQIGARCFLLKKSIATDLPDVLLRLTSNGSAEAVGQGAVITVLSAGGGCGATTIAVNLANELQLTSSESALLIDLDCCYGTMASFLGLDGKYGLANVLSDRDRIDPHLIRTTALVYSKNLQVLISPATTNLTEPPTLAYHHLGRALEVCKRTYGHTVIDAPRVPIDVATTLAGASQATLLVFQLTVKDIRVAKCMLSALTERGVSADRILPLVNRYRKRSRMITLEEAQKALGGISLGRVSNDFPSAMQAANYGHPLAQATPRSALRRDLRELAVKVFQAHVQRANVPVAR